jgi:hypothetical protein
MFEPISVAQLKSCAMKKWVFAVKSALSEKKL